LETQEATNQTSNFGSEVEEVGNEATRNWLFNFRNRNDLW
jgi:hypothetical protein